jgi:hypothetical protein
VILLPQTFTLDYQDHQRCGSRRRFSGIDHKPDHWTYNIHSRIGSVSKFFKMSFSKKIIIPLGLYTILIDHKNSIEQ